MFKTCIVKIHNPSRHKRAVINHAMKQYSLAYDHLLRNAAKRIEDIKPRVLVQRKDHEGNRRFDKDGNPVIRVTPPRFVLNAVAPNSLAKHFDLSGTLRESVRIRATETVVGSIAVTVKDTGQEHHPPKPRLINPEHREDMRKKALDELCNFYPLPKEKEEDSVQRYNRLRDELSKAEKDFLPLSFLRKREIPIFYDEKRNRYYALLNLLSPKSKRTTPCDCPLELLKSPKKEKVPKKPKGSIVVPLEFGTWQEFETMKLLEDKTEIKEAELVKKGDDFFLHLQVNYPEEPKLEDYKTIIGVDLGVNETAAVTVIDRESGETIFQRLFSGKERLAVLKGQRETLRDLQRRGRKIKGLKKQRMLETQAHIVANELLGIAKKYEGRIVFEDLAKIRSRTRQRKELNPFIRKFVLRELNHRISSWNFNQLIQIASYKEQLLGLPKHLAIQAAYTSQTCPVCGHFGRENRPSQDKFKCVKCGHSGNADIIASLNIARRGLELIEKWDKRTLRIS